VGVAMIASATLEEALRTLAGYGGARGRTVRLRYTRSAKYGEIETLESFDLGEMRAFVLEAAVVQISNLITAVAGQQLKSVLFQFPFPSPRWAKKYADALPGRVEFSAKTTLIRIPRKHLSLRSVSADEHARKVALRQCEREAAEIAGDPRREL